MHKINRTFVVSGTFLFVVAAAMAAPAQTFKTLANFNGTNGANPDFVSLVQGWDGNLYGTTAYGGLNGYGTVFQVTPSGTVTTLYSFCAQTNCIDGSVPEAGLVLATDGTFYGTTDEGGIYSDCDFVCGTVFEVTRQGTLNTLYSFDINSHGANPEAALIQDGDGNFYGTTSAEDLSSVFEITSGGALTTLHNLNMSEGAQPHAALVQADGYLYGTTGFFGAYGSGTVFKITPKGAFTTLYNFCSKAHCADGSVPVAALVPGPDGEFYSTTTSGGANDVCLNGGCGTVFKMSSDGRLTTLHSFDGTDGSSPGGLVLGTDGSFYGVASNGGGSDACPNGCGTIFKMTPDGALTTLHAFGSTDGAYPTGALVQATDGLFYGVTFAGGPNGDGTIFSLSVGLGPFVETQRTAGKVGQPVKILGTDLTGATSLTFNGTPATFTVVSPSLIKTTVPAGATSGTVQVVTPGGTLSSKAAFRVLP